MERSDLVANCESVDAHATLLEESGEEATSETGDEKKDDLDSDTEELVDAVDVIREEEEAEEDASREDLPTAATAVKLPHEGAVECGAD